MTLKNNRVPDSERFQARYKRITTVHIIILTDKPFYASNYTSPERYFIVIVDKDGFNPDFIPFREARRENNGSQ
jgi:hypothetical protein